MDRIGRNCRDRTDDIHLHPCATTRMPPLAIVNLAERGCLFGSPPGSRGQHNRQAKEFPNPSRHATDKTSIPRPLKSRYRMDRRQLPAAARCRQPQWGEMSRDSEAGRPDMTAVGVLAKIATHRCRPGAQCAPCRFTEASGTLKISPSCLPSFR